MADEGVGTVIEILSDGEAFEVEFSDGNGQIPWTTIGSASLPHLFTIEIVHAPVRIVHNFA